MSDYHALTYQRHGQRDLRTSGLYHHAGGDVVVTLGLSELVPALMHHALAFVMSDEGPLLVAVQGVATGQNLYVSRTGDWEGGYLPNVYKMYPFRISRTEAGEMILCIDEASGFLCPKGSGTALYDVLGKPSPEMQKLSGEIGLMQQDREQMQRACAMLQKHDLLEPWPLTLSVEGRQKQIIGLLRTNEARLNSLEGNELGELRHCAALMVAYGQLFSMQNIHKLGNLLVRRSKELEAGSREQTEKDMAPSGLISFDNL